MPISKTMTIQAEKKAITIVAGKIAFKKDVCESYGFYLTGKTHIWREWLRQIRIKEGNPKLFKGNWLFPKEVGLLVNYLSKPRN
jgi:hypothetical protein